MAHRAYIVALIMSAKMNIELVKAAKGAAIRVLRDDGSTAESFLPAKGPVPHDAVHYFVERELGCDNAFWGLVAAGHHPETIADIAKASGHASAKRADIPDADFVAAIQVERIVEAFEADHWSGGSGDPGGLVAMARSGCEQSKVEPVEIDAPRVERIRARISEFAAAWDKLPQGGSMTLVWDGPA